MKNYLFLCMIVLLLSCEKQNDYVNLQHSLSLVDSIKVDNKMLSFIWIYADAPDYKHVDASGEGVTCVDDVGRYLEVLEHEILSSQNENLTPIVENMVNFLLYMSRNDGLWYNFMLGDGTINKDHINSKAEFGFWAVRGLRGLSAGYNIFREKPNYENLTKKIKSRIHLMDSQIEKILSNYPKFSASVIDEKPDWMVKGASDITNEFLLVLTKLHNTGNFDYYSEIEKFSEALVHCQYCNQNSEINGMYFCWNNIWHAWGNSHAFALLEAYKITKNDELLKSVKTWADSFVPYFIENKFPRKITVISDKEFKMELYPQIAYGMTSVYRGIKTLADITNNSKYSEYSEQIFQWYMGNNISKTKMYDSKSGRCFDGINKDGINKNSGAESTVECLLSIQMRE